MENYRVAIIGLGYVGLPLALAFGKKFEVVAFDIDEERTCALRRSIDRTRQVPVEAFLDPTRRLTYSSDLQATGQSNVYIVTVPTPVDSYKKPDLTPLLNACAMIGTVLKKNDLVIFESTVYPGCTEEDCIPVLEYRSGLAYNTDFYCGYSPERINPGDKIHTLENIVKVVSGGTPATALTVKYLYDQIITAGTHVASSIKIAEASKIIENVQRDINISFVNELALIFDKMGIDTTEVLQAAATKWNFLPFKPGLVGGHCIGVDPYYLMHKAESLGYYPQVILSGRRINDNMGIFVATKVVKMMVQKGHSLEGAQVLVLGFTFKENCADIRNSRVIDIYNELGQFGVQVAIYDPWADKEQVRAEYDIVLKETLDGPYDAIILAVAHDVFKDIPFDALTKTHTVVFDTKSFLAREWVDARL